ncbi:MAG: sigma-70 family RNA polymerase sigma factor, partial [Alphaproteobacteria bacterium]
RSRLLDVSEKDVIDMDNHMSSSDVYLNSAMSHESEEEKMAFLVDDRADQETVLADHQELQNKRALLANAMMSLNERERDILTRRRLQEPADTLEDLSQAYGISRERVRQIEVRAFEKLQQAMIAQ